MEGSGLKPEICSFWTQICENRWCFRSIRSLSGSQNVSYEAESGRESVTGIVDLQKIARLFYTGQRVRCSARPTSIIISSSGNHQIRWICAVRHPKNAGCTIGLQRLPMERDYLETADRRLVRGKSLRRMSG